MEQSIHYQQILNLGKKLVKLYDKPDDEDFTLKWMSNYLAENILKAERESDPEKRESLQNDIFKTILNLWERRRNFPPNYVPLDGLASFTDIINSFDNNQEEENAHYWRRFRQYEDKTSWGKYLYSLRKSVERSLELATSLVANKEILLKELEWKEQKDLLDSEEKKLIEWLDSAIESEVKSELIQIIIKDGIDSDKIGEVSRIDEAFKKLRKLHNDQGKALTAFEKNFRQSFNIL